MPVKVFNFLPTLLNRANDLAASGFQGVRTLEDINAGGLVLGDAIDLTNWEAASQSDPAVGMLFEGRYRRVQLDPNANVANVLRGTAAFVKPGTSVFALIVLTPGSGQTPGRYRIQATNAGGDTTGGGAIAEVFVSTAGTVIVPPIMANMGGGYTAPPTFTLTGAGGTAATFQAQMSDNTYVVTDASATGVIVAQGRGLFLNPITPGNYGWVQENGIGGFLTSATAAVGAMLTPSTSTGQFAGGGSVPNAFGTALDAGAANAVVRGKISLPVWNG
jgi:hypothetical protein